MKLFKRKRNPKIDYIWGALRICLGFIFLWAFLDKFFGLGFATCRDESGSLTVGCSQAVISGGSPTEGFLRFATEGPLASFYQSLAGNGFIDFIFMIALLGLGVALILGIGMKIAAIGGVLLLVMMWSASWPPDNNPIISDHIVYSIALVGLLTVNDNQKLGLGKRWSRVKLVRNFPILK